MAYSLFKSSNLQQSFLTISDNSEDKTSTSLAWVGRRLVNFGEAMQQNTLWQLENFANSTPPHNPINGQLYYNTGTNQDIFQYFTDASGWKKINSIKTGPNFAVVQTPTEGDFCYNTTTGKLNLFTGGNWVVMGPSDELPINIFQNYAFLGQTSTNTLTELFLNGVASSRLTIPNNSSYLFEISIVARRTDGPAEYCSWKIQAIVDNSNSSVIFGNNPAIEIIGNADSWSANVVADNTNKCLGITVQGENGKQIKWTVVAQATKVSN